MYTKSIKDLKSEEIRNKFTNGDFETISLENEADSIFVLPNSNLISTNKGSITLFDKNLTELKKFHRIGFVRGSALNH